MPCNVWRVTLRQRLAAIRPDGFRLYAQIYHTQLLLMRATLRPSFLPQGSGAAPAAVAAAPAALRFSDTAPSWAELQEMVNARQAQLGVDFYADPETGPTNPTALKRTFGTNGPIRVKLYR